MKKISFLGIIMLLGIHGLVSCEKGTDETTGYVVGVLNHHEADDLYTLSITDTSYMVYCPEFKEKIARQEMEAGGCYYVVYAQDNASPENAPDKVRENGYITASLIDYKVAGKYSLSASLVDTSVVLTDEVPVLNSGSSDQVFGYAAGYLFMTHEIVAQAGYTFDWSLSCDKETMMPATAGDKHYYDLFLRTTLAGDNDQTDTVQHFPLNAYYLGDYMVEAAIKEKEFLTLNAAYNEASTFTIRINYASEIRENVITWKSVEFPAKITYFLPE